MSEEKKYEAYGASMIYNYEAAILKWIHNCLPEVKQATYASNEDLLTGLDTAKYYPSFYYSRDRFDVSIHKPIKVRVKEGEDDLRPYTFYPYEISYSGTMLIENQQAAFRIATTLKYYWKDNPFIQVRVPGIPILDEEGKDVGVRTSLNLQDILIEDVRLPNDKNGACRAVKMKWNSQLFLNNCPAAASDFVDSVAIELQVLDNGTVVEKMNTVVTKEE